MAAAAAAIAAGNAANAVAQVGQIIQQLINDREVNVVLDELKDKSTYFNWNFKLIGELNRLNILQPVRAALEQVVALPLGLLTPQQGRAVKARIRRSGFCVSKQL